jgi:penicillin-binding protein 1A
LLAGSWVGCDDQFIHFTKESYDGQGARAAMPIWAYFYEKVSHDPNIIGIDPSASFAPPQIANNDINYDRVMGITPTQGAALEDAGNGTAEDFGVPNKFNDNNEIKPESDFDLGKPKEAKPDDENPYSPGGSTPLPKQNDDGKNLDLLKKPADKPKKPKAVMSPKG